MNAVQLSTLPTLQRLVRPSAPAWLLAWWSRLRASGTSPGAPDHAAPTTVADLEPAALRDIGMSARGASAREQAARLLMRAGHG